MLLAIEILSRRVVLHGKNSFVIVDNGNGTDRLPFIAEFTVEVVDTMLVFSYDVNLLTPPV